VTLTYGLRLEYPRERSARHSEFPEGGAGRRLTVKRKVPSL
jgi:hypothetical protein